MNVCFLQGEKGKGKGTRGQMGKGITKMGTGRGWRVMGRAKRGKGGQPGTEGCKEEGEERNPGKSGVSERSWE